MLNGICMPGVLPIAAAGLGVSPATTVTVSAVTVEFQRQVTVVPHVNCRAVPSWSWALMVPVALELAVPVMVSLKVMLNASPDSVMPALLYPQSDVPWLLVTRASTRVGGVKSPAPLVKLALLP